MSMASSSPLRQQIGLDSLGVGMDRPGYASPSRLSAERPLNGHYHSDGYESCGSGFGFYLVWFLIIAVITWVVLYSIKPDFVKRADGTVDFGKVLLWSVIIGLIGIFIIWLIKRCASC